MFLNKFLNIPSILNLSIPRALKGKSYRLSLNGKNTPHFTILTPNTSLSLELSHKTPKTTFLNKFLNIPSNLQWGTRTRNVTYLFTPDQVFWLIHNCFAWTWTLLYTCKVFQITKTWCKQSVRWRVFFCYYLETINILMWQNIAGSQPFNAAIVCFHQMLWVTCTIG